MKVGKEKFVVFLRIKMKYGWFYEYVLLNEVFLWEINYL